MNLVIFLIEVGFISILGLCLFLLIEFLYSIEEKLMNLLKKKLTRIKIWYRMKSKRNENGKRNH